MDRVGFEPTTSAHQLPLRQPQQLLTITKQSWLMTIPLKAPPF